MKFKTSPLQTTFISSSVNQTQEIASKLAQKYKLGKVIALSGDLGAGKTTFAQGFAKSLGINQTLLSPTFTLIRQYKIPNASLQTLYHIDLYRIEDISDIHSLGLQDILAEKKNIVLIEWAQRLGSLLPPDTITIKLSIISKQQRRIEVISS